MIDTTKPLLEHLILNAEPLGEPFQTILHENLGSLYEKSDAVIPASEEYQALMAGALE